MDSDQLKSEVKILRANIVCYYDHVSHLRILEDKKLVIETRLNKTGKGIVVVSRDQHNPSDVGRQQLYMDLAEVDTEIESTRVTVRLVEKFFRSLQDQDIKMMRDYAKGKMTIVELAEKYGYSRQGLLWRIKALIRRFILNHIKDYTKCIDFRDNMIV